MYKTEICTKCVMDRTDPDISFDEHGVCNHCKRYDDELSSRVFTAEEGKKELSRLVSRIKRDGAGSDYDCIIGVSGGVDSTYVAWLVKDLGLRPLAIHFDNGWNSELAVKNIEKVLKSLEIELYTYVIDWPEFKDLQLSFLRSDTPDGEVPTDHAINALLFRQAEKRNIKYIINGLNFKSESMKVEKWAYGHADWRYIKNIHKIFGKKTLKNYPHFSLFDLFKFVVLRKIKVVSILNYVDYRKDEVMQFLQEQLGWVYYGGKHYESIYTRFYQSYLLPEKFNIDKRKGHLSDLIRSEQLTRVEALSELRRPTIDSETLNRDLKFVRKKLGLSEEQLTDIICQKPKYFTDYPNNSKKIYFLKRVLNKLRSKGIMNR